MVVEVSRWQVVATHNNWGGAPGMKALVLGVNVVGDKSYLYKTDEINRGTFPIGSVSVGPKSVEMQSGDFRLQSRSPMSGAGMDVGIAFCGSAPDVGELEVCPQVVCVSSRFWRPFFEEAK